MILAAWLSVAEAGESWFSQIRYEVGLSTQLGAGADGSVFADHLIAEPLAFELRSFLWPSVAFHTTLNLGRMIAPALLGDGRIDYDCHLGVHLPAARDLTLVVAPGAAIAYSFTGSGYQRIVGDVRLGLDTHHGAWTSGVYLRPYVGWYSPGDRGRAVGGLVVEVVHVVAVPKRDRGAPPPAPR